jgi:ribosomal protein L10
MSFRQVVLPQDREQLERGLLMPVDAKGRVRTLEDIRAVKKGGQTFDCDVALSEIRQSPGGPSLFTVVIRDITERKRIEAEKTARIEQLERELRSFEQLSRPGRTDATARAFGMKPLRDNAFVTFQALVRRYQDLMDVAVDQRVFGAEQSMPQALHELVDQLASLRAGPRDIVEIHSAAVRGKTSNVPSPKAQAYIEESQFMLLQLMGHLVSHYRPYALGSVAARPSHPTRNSVEEGVQSDG